MTAPSVEGMGGSTRDLGDTGADPDAERTGVMVIRVWMEGADPNDQEVRGRITWRPDLDASGEVVLVAGSIEEITGIVARLLGSFECHDADAPADPHA